MRKTDTSLILNTLLFCTRAPDASRNWDRPVNSNCCQVSGDRVLATWAQLNLELIRSRQSLWNNWTACLRAGIPAYVVYVTTTKQLLDRPSTTVGTQIYPITISDIFVYQIIHRMMRLFVNVWIFCRIKLDFVLRLLKCCRRTASNMNRNSKTAVFHYPVSKEFRIKNCLVDHWT